MTDLLQVLDLIVNAIFKQLTRKLRAKLICDDFDIHQLRLESGELNVPPFSLPSKPSIKVAVDNFFIISKQMRDNISLQQSIKESFVKTGCAPKSDGTYNKYSDTSQFATRGLAVIPVKHSVLIAVEALAEDEDPDDIVDNNNNNEVAEDGVILEEELIGEIDGDELMDEFLDDMYDSDSDDDGEDEVDSEGEYGEIEEDDI